MSAKVRQRIPKLIDLGQEKELLREIYYKKLKI